MTYWFDTTCQKLGLCFIDEEINVTLYGESLSKGRCIIKAIVMSHKNLTTKFCVKLE